MKAIEIKKDVFWVGALDPKLRIFDIIMYTPFGTTYNSYIVKGSKKTAVFETVKVQFFDEYIERLKSFNVDVAKIDYIVVNHTEPDHAGSVAKLLSIAKAAKIVGSTAAIKFLKSIANREFEFITVGDGDSLDLGNKTLKFISAPFLHWPDSIYTYLVEDEILFTCDSFGSHYCNENIFDDEIQNREEYLDALKYYYDCIMSPFAPYVLQAIEKIKALKIQYICTGHGPILRENPQSIIELYKKWSTPQSKNLDVKKVSIAYVSAYGYTKQMAETIAEGIISKGNFQVESFDVTYSKFEDVIASMDTADAMLFGSPTINGDALKPIWDVLTTLNPLVHGKRVAAAFGSYGWSGEAVKYLEERLKQLKLVTIPGLKINFKPSDLELSECFKFGTKFASLVLGENTVKETVEAKVPDPRTVSMKNKKWKCIICGLIMEGPEVPETCPACGASSDQFIEVVEEEILFKSDKKESYIIIGNGIAGFNAAEAIRKRNSVCSIEIISSERYLTYYRPQLSDALSADLLDEQFYLEKEDYYKNNNIKLTLDTMVLDIKPESKTITLIDGTVMSYDKLILANGGIAFLPSLPGTNKQGVHVLRSLNDALEVKCSLDVIKKAIVIGGGLLGLEAAWEMRKKGIEVTVVEFSPRLLPNQLDENGAQVFKKIVASSGVEIILGDSVKEILGDDKVTGLQLSSGKEIAAELVLFSVGVRPNKAVGKNAGLSINNGVLVNDKMETSTKDIYACGDVAELENMVYGNWPASQEMGTVAGRNAVGDTAKFQNFVTSIVFNALNVELFTAGTVNEPNAVHFEMEDNNKNIYKKLFFKEGKLIGGILLGDTSKAVQVVSGIQNGLTLTEMMKQNII
ncbi:MAG: FAD-dependent oxidoreductase [Clostridiaceae bacterium]|nr:FAD-dependent oxidoreductase [Clostridiaceae bacterium]